MDNIFKYSIPIIAFLFLLGCKEEEISTEYNKETNANGFEFICFEALTQGFLSIERCENKEAICYMMTSHSKGGLSCKWKNEDD